MWALDPTLTHLNHGSFGAVPLAVREAQKQWADRWEMATTRFVVEELQDALDAARAEVARFVGASAGGFAFVRNATQGVASVVRSIEPLLREGDEILTTNQAYNAVRQTIEFTAGRTGARVVVVDIPLRISGPDQVTEAILGAAGSNTKLAVIDHISSPTGQVFPVADIVGGLEPEIPVLIDGAHGPGQVPLHLDSLGASWYTGNLHKWVCAPKGAGFLATRPDRLADTFPVAISHGWTVGEPGPDRYRALFDWPGTDDFTPWLASSAAIRFFEAEVAGGWTSLMEANHRLVVQGQEIICDAVGVSPPYPASMIGSMAPVELPDYVGRHDDGALSPIMSDLLVEGHEALVMFWPKPPHQLLRISAHMYNRLADYSALAASLARLL